MLFVLFVHFSHIAIFFSTVLRMPNLFRGFRFTTLASVPDSGRISKILFTNLSACVFNM